MTTIITKTCSTCKQTLPIEEFHHDSSKKDGHSSRCKKCKRVWYDKNVDHVKKQKYERYRKWRQDPEWVSHNREMKLKRYHADPSKARKYRIKMKYGISEQEFNDILLSQNNQCAICPSSSPNGKGWHIDHDHDTGKVRGILCSNCNVGIGMLKHSVQLLSQAILYLEKHNGKIQDHKTETQIPTSN